MQTLRICPRRCVPSLQTAPFWRCTLSVEAIYLHIMQDSRHKQLKMGFLSVRLSQAKLAKEFDVSQSALARYEIDDSTPSPEVFLKYADYFDVSLDYIFGRTDDPHGMIYNNCVKLGLNNPEMARFVEMCFDPGSAMNERLKATLVQMLSEVDAK